MNHYILVVTTVLLAACATTAGFEKILDSWVGAQSIASVYSTGRLDQKPFVYLPLGEFVRVVVLH